MKARAIQTPDGLVVIVPPTELTDGYLADGYLAVLLDNKRALHTRISMVDVAYLLDALAEFAREHPKALLVSAGREVKDEDLVVYISYERPGREVIGLLQTVKAAIREALGTDATRAEKERWARALQLLDEAEQLLSQRGSEE